MSFTSRGLLSTLGLAAITFRITLGEVEGRLVEDTVFSLQQEHMAVVACLFLFTSFLCPIGCKLLTDARGL